MQPPSVLYFALLVAAFSIAQPNHGSDRECCDAKCYKRLVYADSHDMGNASKNCKSYQKTTVTPCPATKTVYTTATVTTTIGSPQEYARDGLVSRHVASRCTPSASINKQPCYAAGYCSGQDWASACSCLGIKPTTVSALQPTVTITKCEDGKTVTKTVMKTTSKGLSSSTSSSCSSTDTTVTQTVTPTGVTSTTTLSSTITQSTSLYGSTITLPASTETSISTIATAVTVTQGTVTVTLPIASLSVVCSTNIGSTITTTTTSTLSITTVLTMNQAQTLFPRRLLDASYTCSPVTKTSTITATPSTTIVTQTPSTIVTNTLTSTVTSGTLSTFTSSYATSTITVSSTVTITPDPTTVCLNTQTFITGTSTITSTTSTIATITSTVFATPTTCNNQGLQWAYYYNPQSNDENDYPEFDDTTIASFKTTTPLDQGVTTTVGGFDYSGNNPPVQFYGSPNNAQSTTFFALDHRGYIHAQITGSYTITMYNVDDIALVWLDPFAQSGWNRENAAEYAVYTNDAGPGAVSQAVTLVAGTYTPIRILYGQGQDVASFFVQITAPDQTSILGSDSSPNNYIVQYSCDGITAPQYPAFGSET